LQRGQEANLLFDLDGTLTDPEEGITGCIAHASEALGVPAPNRTFLRRFIGPPLRESFASLLGTNEQSRIERAVSLYRERFADVGIYENEVYPGTADALRNLVAAGHCLYVATSKPHDYAMLRSAQYWPVMCVNMMLQLRSPTINCG
jgi:phosphoglycolate phosphatase